VKQGWISMDSPLARAMLKKSVDDEFSVDLPQGRKYFVVVDVRYC
jgi:transcription elongation factor GreB